MARLPTLAMRTLLPLFLFLPAVVQAEDKSERVVEHIHSELPLYTFEWNQMWPRGFSDDDGFGCASLVPFGDWRFVPDKLDKTGDGRLEAFRKLRCVSLCRHYS